MSGERPAALEHRTPDWVRAVGKHALHRWGVATAAARPAPDFLVLGTKRGGTTSLFHYLLGHPDVVPMFPARRLKSPFYYSVNHDRGSRWYRSHFATAPYRRALEAVRRRPTVTGEASPYYLYHPQAAERIAAEQPDVKLLIMLRDPVRRAYSHYWERVDNGVEPLGFEAALAAEPARLHGEIERMDRDPSYCSDAHDWYSYRDRGVYAPQLRRYLDRFPADQLLVIRSEDFYADEQTVMDEVTGFLGIAAHRLPTRPRYNHRPAVPMAAHVRSELVDFYRPHNEEVYELLGRDLGWSA